MSVHVQKELKEISRDQASGVTVQLSEGNMQKLTGFVEGPKDTAYEGGYFVVDIVLGLYTTCWLKQHKQPIILHVCYHHAQ